MSKGRLSVEPKYVIESSTKAKLAFARKMPVQRAATNPESGPSRLPARACRYYTPMPNSDAVCVPALA